MADQSPADQLQNLQVINAAFTGTITVVFQIVDKFGKANVYSLQSHPR